MSDSDVPDPPPKRARRVVEESDGEEAEAGPAPPDLPTPMPVESEEDLMDGAVEEVQKRLAARMRWCKYQVTDCVFTVIPATDMHMIDVQTRATEAFNQGELMYMRCQLEKSPKTGTIHIQGYLELPRKQAQGSILKKFLWDTSYLRPRRGTRYEAAVYCAKADTKVGERWEIGVSPKQTYVEQRMKAVEESRTTENRVRLEIMDHPEVKFFDRPQWFREWATKHWQAYKQMLEDVKMMAPERHKVRGHVFWGPTHTGKTFAAEAACAALGVSEPFKMTFERGVQHWWNGYGGERAVMFEEFDPDAVHPNVFKRLFDKRGCRLGEKGSHRMAKWKHVFITSNRDPKTWWQNWEEADRTACMKRLKEIVHMTEYVESSDSESE